MGDVTELAEPARGAGINVLGDSGEQSLEMQGWETAYNPVEVGDPSLYESGESIPDRTVIETSISDSAAA